MAFATRQPDHRWLINQLIKIDRPSALFQFLRSSLIQPGCILAGFDFPIGLPAAYASKAGITDFMAALPRLGRTEWVDFYIPADDPNQISLQRPFYPARPGNSKRLHLEQGLGIPFHLLYRLCEVAHKNRRAACPLFWTMGGQQVGKAAISGWETLLSPALHDPDLHLHIWPFSGPLHDLCRPGNIVAVETYPAEFYDHLNLSFAWPVRRSKRRQADRIAFADLLLGFTDDLGIDLSSPIQTKIREGFGSNLDGEDQFDALVGLYGMINVIQGKRSIGEPRSPLVSKIEGWIFGQDQASEDTYLGSRKP